uniref:Uncharacterized protein n=1 Tax=Arundo donax TaxID=35708 RepID=A0A0A9FB09_ARUDO
MVASSWFMCSFHNRASSSGSGMPPNSCSGGVFSSTVLKNNGRSLRAGTNNCPTWPSVIRTILATSHSTEVWDDRSEASPARAWKIQARREVRKRSSAWGGASDGASIAAAAASASAWAATGRRRSARRSRARCAICGRNASTSRAWCESSGNRAAAAASRESRPCTTCARRYRPAASRSRPSSSRPQMCSGVSTRYLARAASEYSRARPPDGAGEAALAAGASGGGESDEREPEMRERLSEMESEDCLMRSMESAESRRSR